MEKNMSDNMTEYLVYNTQDNMSFEEKLKSSFSEMLVYKDLKKASIISSLGLPSFLRDWLLKTFQNENGDFDSMQVSQFVDKYLPKKDEWLSIKNRITVENERVRILTRISVDINIANQEVSFSLGDYGLSNKETIIEPEVWDGSRYEPDIVVIHLGTNDMRDVVKLAEKTD